MSQSTARAEVAATAIGIMRGLLLVIPFRRTMPATYRVIASVVSEWDRIDAADSLEAITVAEDAIERARRGHV